jgi:hypothetical protein
VQSFLADAALERLERERVELDVDLGVVGV